MRKRLTVLVLLLAYAAAAPGFAESNTKRRARYEAAGVPWPVIRKIDLIYKVADYEQTTLKDQIKVLRKQVADSGGNKHELRRLQVQLRALRTAADQRADALLSPAQRAKLSTATTQPTSAKSGVDQGGVGLPQGGVWSGR